MWLSRPRGYPIEGFRDYHALGCCCPKPVHPFATAVGIWSSPDFSPGFGILVQAGEAGWSIARRGIAVAMGEQDIEKGPVDLLPCERAYPGGCALDHRAQQDSEALMEGGSAKMRRQIGPKTE